MVLEPAKKSTRKYGLNNLRVHLPLKYIFVILVRDQSHFLVQNMRLEKFQVVIFGRKLGIQVIISVNSYNIIVSLSTHL